MFEYACDPEMAQNSTRVVSRDHVFFPEMAHFFQLENPEIAQEKTRDHEKLNGSSFEPSQDHMHIQTCDIGSFDDFLSYLRVRPVLGNSSRVPCVTTWKGENTICMPGAFIVHLNYCHPTTSIIKSFMLKH